MNDTNSNQNSPVTASQNSKINKKMLGVAFIISILINAFLLLKVHKQSSRIKDLQEIAITYYAEIYGPNSKQHVEDTRSNNMAKDETSTSGEQKTQVRDMSTEYPSPSGNKSVTIKNKTPESYQPYDREGAFYEVMQDLLVKPNVNDPSTFYTLDGYKISPLRFIEQLKDIKAMVSYTMGLRALKWDENEKNFWGVIYMRDGGDPPLPIDLMPFKLNVDEKIITNYKLENYGGHKFWFEADALNIEKEMVLLENMDYDGTLNLYLYDLNSKEKELIISFPPEFTLKEYGDDFAYLMYYYGKDWFDKDTKNKLEPKWIDDDHISYKNLGNGEIVEVGLSDL